MTEQKHTIYVSGTTSRNSFLGVPQNGDIVEIKDVPYYLQRRWTSSGKLKLPASLVFTSIRMRYE